MITGTIKDLQKLMEVFGTQAKVAEILNGKAIINFKK